MTHTSKTIVFFGTDEFSATSLNELISKGFPVGAVVTKPDSRKGRGRELSKSAVKEIAEAHGIPVLQPVSIHDLTDPLKKVIQENSTQAVGVLVSYGKIIPQSIIDLFEPGIINVHPSLLPKYRGPSPVESAILNGDPETGVTIMQLSAAMDAGPIYSQITIALTGIETTPELEPLLAERGAQELSRVLPGIIDGTVTPTPQHDESATYCQLLSKDDAQLIPNEVTAEQAERRIRAYLAFPKTKMTIEGHPIVITKAHVSTTQETPLDIKCADETYLSIDTLIGPSGRAMDAKAFLNGYITKQ